MLDTQTTNQRSVRTRSLRMSAPTKLVERQTRPRELIEPSLFPVLQRYTKFAVASLATFTFNLGACPRPPFGSKLVKTINNILTDTQVAVFQDDTAKEYIVSFPGSSSVQDAVTDINYFLMPFTTAPGCNACQVHNDLLIGWRSVQQQFTTALADLQTQHSDYSIMTVDHFLSGGLASLAYTDLKVNSTIGINYAYTMASLRIGNQAYADFTDTLSRASESALGSLIRISHNTDGVPNLPRETMGFRHTRTEIYQLDGAARTQTAQTSHRCFGQEAVDCNRATAIGVINQDHLMYSGVVMTDGQTCQS
ncbi:alpha/beta-hydrolase [Plenodomus tracheiphilus IPT5]|uniref:Alpha/beta-hydrolase n=1 Tax=Plenodomus tracheiphilus IPT5 TaxID=1408161 RepID=A0A6A7BDD1_9PLEO|nr:alpha/beta-hydrolase [Plenodomus tracheiphilus IPT5]